MDQNFVICIKGTENHSWQGSINWVNGKKSENFRSALELIKLIDSALPKNESEKKENA